MPDFIDLSDLDALAAPVDKKADIDLSDLDAISLKKKEEPSSDMPLNGGKTEGQQPLPLKGDRYIKGEIGDYLESAGELGDFVDDMARAWGQGASQAAPVEESIKTIFGGANTSSETIQNLISDVEDMGDIAPSDEFMEYQKIYQEESEKGSPIWGVIKGIGKNPTVAPQILLSSVRAMMNKASLTAGGAVVASGAVKGAIVGTAASPAGTLAGAASGATASMPLAMAAAGGTLEVASSFAEFLQEEIAKKGMNFDEDGVRSVLEDEKVFNRIRNKAIARGATITAVDALGGRLATSLGAKIASKVGAKVGRRVGAKAAIVGVEAVTGSTGEAAARAVTGQDMDVSEIALEGIAETVGAPASIMAAGLKAQSYTINGNPESKDKAIEFINTATDAEISEANIDIKNDQALSAVVDIKKSKHAIDSEIPNEIQGGDRAELVELELERQKYAGRKTRSSKNKLKGIDERIDEIMSVDRERIDFSEATSEALSAIESGETVKDPAAAISELEKLKNGATNKENVKVIDEYISKLRGIKTEEGVDAKENETGVEETMQKEEVVEGKVQRTGVLDDEKTGVESEEEVGSEASSDVTMRNVSSIIDKVSDRAHADTDPDVLKERQRSAAVSYLQKSKWYESISDVERETAVGDVVKQIGIKQKKAPSVAKVLGKEKKKIVVDEAAALKDQIRLEARAAKNVIREQNKSAKEVKEDIKGMFKKGKISQNKTRAITNKLMGTNLLSSKSTKALTNYIDKVMTDSNNVEKLSNANTLRKRIKSRLKNVDADVREVAKALISVDPTLVEDVDAHIESLTNMSKGLASSRVTADGVKQKTSVDIAAAKEYADKVVKMQQESDFESYKEDFQDVTGIDPSGMTMEDMDAAMDKVDEGVSDTKGKIIRDNAIKYFEDVSPVAKKMITENKDPFTGEVLGLSKEDRALALEMNDMDVSLMSTREIMKAADAISDFAANGTTGKMGAVVSDHRGVKNAAALAKRKVKAKKYKLFGVSSRFGRWQNAALNQIDLMFQNLFHGEQAGYNVQKSIGFIDFANGTHKADKSITDMVSAYTGLMEKLKPNGEAWNTVANITERGMYAALVRTNREAGEFGRVKGLIEESINVLAEGNDKQKALSEVYKTVYDKVVKDAKTAEDVKKKADKSNVKGVQFLIDRWSDIYDDVSDVSLKYHNRRLSRDENYTSHAMRKVDPSRRDKKSELLTDATFDMTSGTVYKEKAGVMEEANRPKVLPREGKTIDRYLSLDFDADQVNAMHDAMIHINTVDAAFQMNGFLNSKDFNAIFPDAEERNIVRRRLTNYISSKRSRKFVDKDGMEIVTKITDGVAKYAATITLGGVTQPLKQVIPVMGNTIVNAGSLPIGDLMNSDINKIIDESGRGVTTRGVEAQFAMEGFNKKLEAAAEGGVDKVAKVMGENNEWYLKNLLVKPDVYVAKLSWWAYYKQSLKKQGLDTGTISWADHKLNEKAADYAQMKLNRQQNTSDRDMMGEWLASNESSAKIMKNVLIPFMNFVINQKGRIHSDVNTLASKTASKEDKTAAARSFTGAFVEGVMFNVISQAISEMVVAGAYAVIGGAEREKDKEDRRKFAMKYRTTNMFLDFVSPFPVFDAVLVHSVNSALKASGVDKEAYEMYTFASDEYNKLGLLGIPLKKMDDYKELLDMSIDGKYTETSFGSERTKKIRNTDVDVVRSLVILNTLYLSGYLPSEVGTTSNKIVNIIKKRAKTKKAK